MQALSEHLASVARQLSNQKQSCPTWKILRDAHTRGLHSLLQAGRHFSTSHARAPAPHVRIACQISTIRRLHLIVSVILYHMNGGQESVKANDCLLRHFEMMLLYWRRQRMRKHVALKIHDSQLLKLLVRTMRKWLAVKLQHGGRRWLRVKAISMHRAGQRCVVLKVGAFCRWKAGVRHLKKLRSLCEFCRRIRVLHAISRVVNSFIQYARTQRQKRKRSDISERRCLISACFTAKSCSFTAWVVGTIARQRDSVLAQAQNLDTELEYLQVKRTEVIQQRYDERRKASEARLRYLAFAAWTALCIECRRNWRVCSSLRRTATVRKRMQLVYEVLWAWRHRISQVQIAAKARSKARRHTLRAVLTSWSDVVNRNTRANDFYLTLRKFTGLAHSRRLMCSWRQRVAGRRRTKISYSRVLVRMVKHSLSMNFSRWRDIAATGRLYESMILGARRRKLRHLLPHFYKRWLFISEENRTQNRFHSFPS